MKASPFRTESARVLALCLMACLPALASAAPAPARKARVRKTPVRKDDFEASFAAAVRLYDNLEYERALEQLSRANALTRNTEQEVAVALYQGIVQAELGDRVQSLASFRTALYLQPDAKLPVQVSPKVERDFEEVRQSVLNDLGTSEPSPQPQAQADRPVAQSPGLDSPVVPPPQQPPAFVPSVSEEQPSSPRVLPLAFLGVGAVAGGAAGFFGLQSATNLSFARDAAFYDERVTHLRSAKNQAFVANILFGTASAAALGALATFLIPGSPSAPAPASTGGGSP
jgi:tetratricopeptide (TPR) repeat protein